MRSFHLLCAAVIISIACGSPPTAPHPTEYDRIFAFPSLQAIKEDLASISAVDVNGQSYNGREIVDRFLASYNPNTGAEGLQQTTAYWQTYTNYFRDSGSRSYKMPRAHMTLYLYKIAHAVWAEAHGDLPWSLRDNSTDDLQASFWESGTTLLYPDDLAQPFIPHIEFEYSVYGLAWPIVEPIVEVESLYHAWSLAQKLRRETVEATTLNTIKWVKDSFALHTYFGNTDPKASIFETALRVRHIGDYGFYGARLMQAVLTSLNIANVVFLPTAALPTQPARPIYLYVPALKRFIEPLLFAYYTLAPSSDFLFPGTFVKDGRTPVPQLLRYVNGDATSPLTAVSVAVKQNTSSDPPYITPEVNTPYRLFTPADIARIKTEFPQYPLYYLMDGTWAGFEPLPLRSFEELITPGIDIWH